MESSPHPIKPRSRCCGGASSPTAWWTPSFWRWSWPPCMTCRGRCVLR